MNTTKMNEITLSTGLLARLFDVLSLLISQWRKKYFEKKIEIQNKDILKPEYFAGYNLFYGVKRYFEHGNDQKKIYRYVKMYMLMICKMQKKDVSKFCFLHFCKRFPFSHFSNNHLKQLRK